MMVGLCARNNIELINIVRREEQVKILEETGGKNILNSSTETFWDDLKALIEQKKPNVCLECVSGELTGQILNIMPRRAVSILYGALSLEGPWGINVMNFLYQNKKLESFILPEHMGQKSLLQKVSFVRKTSALLPTLLKSEISREFGLHQFDEAMEYYKNNMTQGKVIFKPSLTE